MTELFAAKSTAVRVAQAPVRFYRRYLSRLKPPTCRYYPTCSQYALDALEEYGAAKGSWMAVKRICRCHPFHPGGIDKVPPNPRRRKPGES
jgi:putative membrane protein insertion efficiency factor